MGYGYKCDICQRLYEPHHIASASTNAVIGTDSMVIREVSVNDKIYGSKICDICPDCKRSINAWIVSRRAKQDAITKMLDNCKATEDDLK